MSESYLDPRRKPIVTGWKTISERDNQKPGARTKQEIAQADFSYTAIKDEAPAIIASAIRNKWAIYPGGTIPEHWNKRRHRTGDSVDSETAGEASGRDPSAKPASTQAEFSQEQVWLRDHPVKASKCYDPFGRKD